MQVGGVSHCSWARLRQAGTHTERRQIAKVHAHTHTLTHTLSHTLTHTHTHTGKADSVMESGILEKDGS